jgi:hypothetical protein
MTSRAQVVLTSKALRERAHDWINKAPTGTRIDFKGPRRSVIQNDRMWAMLTDVATQKTHAGRRFTTDEWKVLFMHACGRQVQFLPALDGGAFVPYGQSSSDLSVAEMTDLIEFMFSWGAENGVVWSDPTQPYELAEVSA